MALKKILLSTVAVIFLLQSCCTKVNCTGFEGERAINLVNFTAADVDSVIVEVFENGSNLSVRIDSSLTSASPNSGNNSFTLIVNEGFDVNHAYKITFPGISKSYVLSDLETKKEACNSCFPYHPKSDYYSALNSYNFNGQRQTGATLQISK
jgi:hypothetical protein